MHRFRLIRRRVLAAAVLPLLTGCHVWQPTAVAPQSLIADERPERIRVTLSSGTMMTMVDPAIVGDSIVGFTFSGTTRAATSDVRAVDAWRFSATRTSGLVIAQVSTVISFLALVVHFQPHYRGF